MIEWGCKAVIRLIHCAAMLKNPRVKPCGAVGRGGNTTVKRIAALFLCFLTIPIFYPLGR